LKILRKTFEIEQIIADLKSKNQEIGFVPTMGALHDGHLSLVEKSVKENSVTIVSIFVNPTQFNNSDDYDKYPNTIDEDIKLLEKTNCDYVFLPTKGEIYTSEYVFPEINIGLLDQMMEGKHRPGHFKGVMQVVYRFFEIIRPNKAYFGLKDFQQVAVIKKMTDFFMLPIEIIACTTVREKDGLAMSSRNLRLSQGQRIEALFIYESLILAKNLSAKFSPQEVIKIINDLYKESSLKLEYFEIINPENFEVLRDNWHPNSIACIVAYVGEIRLIDNMFLLKS
jgi:pantoate--beta-alanine ligase